MIFRKREELTVLELNTDKTDTVAFDMLAELLLVKPANIIYCVQCGKLYGIISIGDIARAAEKGEKYVKINTKFTYVLESEFKQARIIFFSQKAINAIPIVSMSNELAGDYLRWEDLLLLSVYLQSGMGALHLRGILAAGVTLVRPSLSSAYKQKIFLLFYEYLLSYRVPVKCVEYSDIGACGREEKIVLVDEEERRAMIGLFKYIWKAELVRESKGVRGDNFTTYLALFGESIYEEIGEYLGNLSKSGVHILNLRLGYQDKYWDRMRKKICDKYNMAGKKVGNRLYDMMYSGFFAELYTESYANEIIHINCSVETKSGCGKLKDCSSKYYNVKNGERHTFGQPEVFGKTIYVVGSCFIYGRYVEDKYTIESLLQKRLNESGYHIRVVNCGSFYDKRPEVQLARIMELPLKKGDIVIVFEDNRPLTGIVELDLMDALKENDVPAQWLVDHPTHCNHKVNSLYAEAIYNKIEKILPEEADERGKALGRRQDFVNQIYINRYFKDFKYFSYERIGSVVMNCNPFTYGHRYLIEQALSIVDFLIIFVVEEDKSLFSFAERFAMVCAGVADLKNVMVVPSGPFILSRTTFPEYFVKEVDVDIIENVENDIRIFAMHIAPYLHINIRFVGEELQDEVTCEYNIAMKRILPQYGINVVEIPRKQWGNQPISASLVRRCFEEQDTDMLGGLIPESTIRILSGIIE